MQWIRTHKNIIISGIIVVVVLTAAFFLGNPHDSGQAANGGVATGDSQEANGLAKATADNLDGDGTEKGTEADSKVDSEAASEADVEASTETNAKTNAETNIEADNAKGETRAEVTGSEGNGKQATEGATPSVTTEAAKGQVAGTEQTTAAGSGNTTGESSTTEKVTTEQTAATTTEAVTFQCSITISCADILNHMDTLKPEKEGLIPANGVILSTTITVTEGETVYEVLRRACTNAGIPMDASAGYVKGIQNIYEFDCGGISGWKYCVNGTYPNYGSSSYILKEGDIIQWNYICN